MPEGFNAELAVAQQEVQQNETKSEKEKFIDDMMSILESVENDGRPNGKEPDRAKQRQILNKLPDTIVMELHGHINAHAITQEAYGSLDRMKDDVVLRGEVFERLAQAEFDSKPQELGGLMLALLNNPDRFDLKDELGSFRNPDMAYVEMDQETHKLIVTASGECKLGMLNRRSYLQLKESGFRNGLIRVVEYLNSNKDEITQKGLGDLYEGDIEQITVSEGYKQYLIVPDNRDISKPKNFIDIESFENRRTRDINFDEFNDYAKKLENGDILLKNSAFSGAEVAALSEELMKRIDARVK